MTKEQKILVWEKVLENLIPTFSGGFCILLSQSTVDVLHNKEILWKIYNNIDDYFPELVKYKPKDVLPNTFWWKNSDHTKRRQIAKSILKELKK